MFAEAAKMLVPDEVSSFLCFSGCWSSFFEKFVNAEILRMPSGKLLLIFHNFAGGEGIKQKVLFSYFNFSSFIFPLETFQFFLMAI